MKDRERMVTIRRRIPSQITIAGSKLLIDMDSCFCCKNSKSLQIPFQCTLLSGRQEWGLWRVLYISLCLLTFRASVGDGIAHVRLINLFTYTLPPAEGNVMCRYVHTYVDCVRNFNPFNCMFFPTLLTFIYIHYVLHVDLIRGITRMRKNK